MRCDDERKAGVAIERERMERLTSGYKMQIREEEEVPDMPGFTIQ